MSLRLYAIIGISLTILVALSVLLSHARKAGGDAVRVEVQQAHTEAATEAREDERAMQRASDQTGVATAVRTSDSTDRTAIIVEEIRNASAQSQAAGTAAAAVERGRIVLDRLNAAIARANRAAGAAEAAAGTDANRKAGAAGER